MENARAKERERERLREIKSEIENERKFTLYIYKLWLLRMNYYDY